MSEQESRLRPHPVGRFAGEIHVIDLKQALRELRGEAHASTHGHRQVTLLHRAPVTQVLFAFEAGGEMPEHAANGLVTIHVLEGHMAIEAAGETHELGAGTVLALSPGVRHSLRAREASAVLLTVHLEHQAEGDRP